ncbi:MAG TPA: glycerophosphodiester phosphodiesterase [Acidimicrobiales bacterium]|nr:glycerophosphodiester phosphodiesterase [Acidimicrobiales bacterium]
MATNRWLERRVLAYAHQGGAREAPSSTLYALRKAVEAGAHALELDVHATADGHLVVCHDETVDRTTDGSGAIGSLTLDELRRLDNAYWWVPGEQVVHGLGPDAYPLRGRAPEDRELGIATLREVLEAFPTTILNLDIKATAPAVVPYEQALADLLREYERTDDVIVASFWDTATDAFSFIAPEIPTSMGTLATAAFYQAVQAGESPASTRHVALQVPPQHSGLTIVDERFVTVAHEQGVAVHVWTIDDVAQMEAMVDLDVDGIISDRPTALVDVLRRRDVAWPG